MQNVFIALTKKEKVTPEDKRPRECVLFQMGWSGVPY